MLHRVLGIHPAGSVSTLAIILIAGMLTAGPVTGESAKGTAVNAAGGETSVNTSRGVAALQIGPEVTGLTLTSTSGGDLTTDSLICGYTLGGTATTAATAWYVNSLPMMIAYLPMEGGAVKSLLDYSGSGNNGTAAGDPAWLAAGGFDGNGCFDFDGNDHIDLGNIFPTGPYTKVAWVYYIPGASYNNIISGQTNHAFWVFNTAGAFRLTAGHNGTWDMVADPDPFPVNTWTFTAVTYDGNTLKLYRNGVLVDSATGIPAISSDTRAYIGSFTNGCCWILGRIDDARIYGRALSGEQIAALYGGGAGNNDMIVPQETSTGDVWEACVTPFSSTEAGATTCTGTLMITTPPETPIITSAPVTTGYVGVLYTYDVEATGYPAPFFELTVSPTGMAIDSLTGEIAWIPGATGDFGVEVRASNTEGEDTQAYIVSVTEPPPCPLEMTHYWKLDENPGPPYADEVGGNDATCTSCPAPVAGIVGDAQHFDGVSDEVYVSDDDTWDWDKDASFSIAYWMKTGSTLADNRVLVARDDAVNSLHWWIGYDGTKKARFQLRDVNNNGAYIGGKGIVLNDNIWHFIVAVRDNGADMNRLYVDGAKVDSAYFDYTAGFHGTAELNIGYINLSHHYRYEGDIDELATFDRALTDAEILAYYNDGLIGEGYCEEEPAAPVIVSEPDTLGVVGQLYMYDVDAIGIPTPTYDLIVFPAGMTIDPVTGEIEWTPAAAGDYAVTVEAENTEGTDTQSYTIHVSEPPPCPADMISYWKLDETGGTTYADFYGGNDASASPTPPTPSTDGIVGGCQVLNGTNNYMTAPDNGSFDWSSTSSFTIECWCRFTVIGGKNKVMVGRDQGGGSPHWWLGARSSDGLPIFYLLDTSVSGDFCLGSAAINDDVWHHLVAIRDGSVDMNRLYVDGAKVDSVYYDYGAGFEASTQMDIGYMAYNGTPDYFYNGRLDEVAIYDRALTDTEIAQHYTNGLAGFGYCEEVEVAPVITSTPVTEGFVGEPYSYDVNATGYPVPSFELTVSPAGMAIDSVTGVITWTPGAEGDYDVEVRASNSAGDDTQAYILSISGPPPCPVTCTHYWKLDENPGPPYADEVGGNDATCTNCPAPVTGIVGGAQHFDGTDDEVYAPDDGTWDWDKDASFSICYWMRSSASTSGNRVLAARDDPSSSLHWWVGCDDTGRERFQLRDVNGNGVYIGNKGAVLNDGDWHFIVAVRDNSADMNRIYVDGVKTDSAFHDYTAGFQGAVDFTIGHIDLGGRYRYEGDIDEVATFDKALTDAEILAYYSDGLTGKGYCEEEPFAPVITSTPVTEGFVGELYTYDIEATGYPAPHFVLLTSPSGMVIDSLTGIIEWTPGAEGNYDVLVEAYNVAGADSQSYQITVAVLLHPELENLLLEATSENGNENNDLICTYDLTGSATTAATAWLVDGAPIMALYLPMEGGPVTALLDYSGGGGGGVAATPNGDPTWSATAGHDGHGAFVFDGNDDLDAGEQFPVSGSYTKTAWVYRTGSGANGGNNIISGDENSGGHAFWAPDAYANKLSGGHNATWNIVQDGEALALDTWYFVALSFDYDSRLIVLYKNGAMVDSATVVLANREVTDASVSIGSFGASNGWMWQGTIDDARIYNRALSPEQVMTLYTEGIDIVDAEETVVDEEWQACVTPFSSEEAGSTYCSNTVAITEVVATLLRDFEAFLGDFGVTVKWRLAEVGEGMTFYVMRAGGTSGAFVEIAHPEITVDGLSFSFWDTGCEPGSTYRYRVDVKDEDGRRILFETGEISIPVMPLTLYQNYPNPFNPSTMIRFMLPEKGHVRLDIFDAQGRLVATLADETMAKGFKEVAWNGRTHGGNIASSGVYFYRLKAGNEVLTKKMLLLR